MSVAIQGRVPSVYNERTAAQITERFQALERALGGASPLSYTSPSVPAFGRGSGGGGGSTSAGTTSTVPEVVTEWWGRKFLLMGA